MERQTVEMIAGFGSSMIFVLSNFPMVAKAVRTRNLKSYSFSQILMANVGNLLYWLYVVGLPMGPIWFLHGFNTAVSILMLTLYLCFEAKPEIAQRLSVGKAATRLTAVSFLLNTLGRK
ncbi:MAG: hypothetical protein DHS20C20_23320 [Ardenticatenaceae bacterium]|nr:MAG: hypothetical protein DHS20C20_23320 [Ardenticatenaceae bacterium]